jgi:hypothetical protein
MKKAFFFISLILLFLAPLAAQSITVTSPAAGAQWCQGTGYAITWTSAGVSGPVAIKLRLANAPDAPPVLDIVASTGNAGTYTWPVPASVPAGSYVVRVRTVSDSPLVYDDSDAFTIKACAPTVARFPDREVPPPIALLGKPRLEVSGIDLAPNAEGFGIVFSYKNAGNGPLPKASEVPVKPSYRVLVDGKETASGSLFIPAFAAQPGWEQWGYFGGWIVLPSVRDAFNANWHIGDTVTVCINENEALGMPSHSLSLPLKPIALKYKYDLRYTDVRLDWKNYIVTVSLSLDGNVPPGRELQVYCGNMAGSDSNFKVKQPAKPGSYTFSGKVKNMNIATSDINIYLLILVTSPDVSRVWDIDIRNNSQFAFRFVGHNPAPVQ